jgi:ABC-type multidrug transport system ATPase subunit
MQSVIEIENLTKRFGKVTAVNGVSTSIRKGEIYGFLGLNGAGKTTMIRVLTGMIRPIQDRPDYSVKKSRLIVAISGRASVIWWRFRIPIPT